MLDDRRSPLPTRFSTARPQPARRVLVTLLFAASSLPAAAGAQLGVPGSQIFHQADGVLPGEADEFEMFGLELAAGDFDGDGRDDLAIGAPFERVIPFDEAGTVTVIYGTEDGLDGSLAELWTYESATPHFANTSARFGRALASADFDGDGFDDLAVGIPGLDIDETFGDFQVGAGALLVLYGTASGLSDAGAEVRSLDSTGVPGSPEESDYFGTELAAGDFDRDGYADLAVGTPSKAVGEAAAGTVTIFHGASDGLSAAALHQTWTQDSTDVADQTEENDRFGAVLAAGDLNGDGFDDLAISAPGEDWSGANSAGAVHLLVGSANGLDGDGSTFLVQATSGVEASEQNDQFGDALAIGDLDGDGVGDLVVGTPYEGIDFDAMTIEDSGAILVYLGSSTTGPGVSADDAFDLIELFALDSPLDRFGAALALGAFGEGPAKGLAVGAPGFDTENQDDGGAVFELSGYFAGGFEWIYTLSQSGAVPGIVEAGDEAGSALAAGDFDGDGFDDLALGAPYEEAGGLDFAGAVNVLYSQGLFRDGFERGDPARWSEEIAN